TLADVNELALLHSVVHDLHLAALPDVYREAEHAGVVALLRSGFDRSRGAAWLAEQEGTAVGYALTDLRELAENVLHKPRRILEVVQIGVRPDHQRRGIGRALMN